jgi:tetratricopeptide (TPR) repeat protein
VGGGSSTQAGLIQTSPSGFRGRCVETLEKLGDTAMDSKKYDEAIKRYSDALTLDPTNQRDILLKRSKVRAVMVSWEEALIDADKVWIAFHVTSDGSQ